MSKDIRGVAMSSSSPRTISRLLANSRYWIGPLKQCSGRIKCKKGIQLIVSLYLYIELDKYQSFRRYSGHKVYPKLRNTSGIKYPFLIEIRILSFRAILSVKNILFFWQTVKWKMMFPGQLCHAVTLSVWKPKQEKKKTLLCWSFPPPTPLTTLYNAM